MPTTEKFIINNLLNPIGAEVEKLKQKIRSLQKKNSLSLSLSEIQLREKLIDLSKRISMRSSDRAAHILSLMFTSEEKTVVKIILEQRVRDYLLFATKMPKPQLLSKLRPLGEVLRLNLNNQSRSSWNVLLTYYIVARIGESLRLSLSRLTMDELLVITKEYDQLPEYECVFSLYYFIHAHDHFSQHQLAVAKWKRNVDNEINQYSLSRYAEINWYCGKVFILASVLSLFLYADMNLNYFPVYSVSGLTVDQLKQAVFYHGGFVVFLKLLIHTSHLNLNLNRLGLCRDWFDSYGLLNLPLLLLHFTLPFAILVLSQGAMGPLNQWLNPQAGSLSGGAGVMAFILTLMDVSVLRLLFNVMPAAMANGLSLLFLLKTVPWTWDQSPLFGSNFADESVVHSFINVGKMGLLHLVPLLIFCLMDRDRVQKIALLRAQKARLSHPGLSYNKKQGEDDVINRLEQASEYIRPSH